MLCVVLFHLLDAASDMLSDMERCLKEMESCFELLLPSVADFTPRLVEPVKPPAASLSSVPLSSSATVDGEVTEPSAAKDVRKEHEFSRTATSDASRRSDRTRSVCSVSSSTSGSAPVGERKARLSRVLSGSSTDYEAVRYLSGVCCTSACLSTCLSVRPVRPSLKLHHAT